ncbi:hypothetical protein SAMN05519103_01921 [Rhizobiales bacterium GAS113]|nr:hypothetical protein SAMN05519103_01921 [Rhizobiales bacterium GAS113]
MAQRQHLDFVQKLSKSTPRAKLARDDPTRVALAAAIAKYEDRKRELAANEKAIEACLARITTARRAVETAEQQVEKAKDDAARFLVDKELGRATKEPLTVAQAGTGLQDAQDVLEAGYEAHRRLQAEHNGEPGKGGGLPNRVSLAEINVGHAVAEVVKSDPAAQSILRRWDAIQFEYASLHQLMEWLDRGHMLPDEYKSWNAIREHRDPPNFGEFKAAVGSLKTDANARLPDALEGLLRPPSVTPPTITNGKAAEPVTERDGVRRYGA